MIWNICFSVSAIILSASVFYALISKEKYRSEKLLTPFNTVFAGVFIAVFTGLIPIFADTLAEEPAFLLKLCLFDALQTIQVFTINVGADLIIENINAATTTISGIYSAYMTCLFFAAPLLTFGFLMSLFRNLLTVFSYRLNFRKNVYAFSELNENSLILAQDIKKNHGDVLIMFTDTKDADEKLLEESKELKAINTEKNICTFDFSFHSKKSSLIFLVMGENESENVTCALELMTKYRERKQTDLYVFSDSADGELLLSNADKGEIRLRRMNETRSLIYRYLYDSGTEIFDSAKVNEDGTKEITVVIAGLGKYGTEMLRALSWYCQMVGFSVHIHAFDKDELAEDKFTALCPELMPEKYYGRPPSDEHSYDITIHSATDVETNTFAKVISSIPDITFVFVALGDDRQNIIQSAKIRMLCERVNAKPIIKTVIYNTQANEALNGICNYRAQPYGIDAIGDTQFAYSEEILIGSELEKKALERHLKWGQEDEFWKFEYNYRSSMASAIHIKARILCGIQSDEEQLSDDERAIIEPLEHRRWNAYVRSEGYIYSGSTEKSSRNDLGKMHHDLVDFDALSEEEKRKDCAVISLS